MPKPIARKDSKGRALRTGEVYREKEGRYSYSYIDPLGRRRYIYSNSLLKLREREMNIHKDILDGINSYAAGIATLNMAFDRYMSTKHNLRASTRTNYIYMYDRFVRKTIGRKKITEIKFSDMNFFYYHLLNEMHLQPNTLDSIHTLLHPTFAMAIRDNVIRTNPTSGVMAEIKRGCGKNKGIRHALTLKQQRAFMNYMINNPVYYHWVPLFVVLLGTGGRIGEIIGLRWQDIDMEERVVNINHSITYFARDENHTKTAEFQVSLPKTAAGVRSIPMTDEVYEAFCIENEKQEKSGRNKTVIGDMDGFIFTNRFGNVHNPQSINRTIKRIYESYNAEEILKAAREHRKPVLIPHFSCHHLRHTFATRLCEQETNLKVIQEIMGHANIETTMDVYAEATAEKKQETMTRLSDNLQLF